MKAVSLLMLLALAPIGSALDAQTVVQPEPALDPAQRTVRTSLYQLRDSLQQVEAASARIARDLQRASDAALRSRARIMADRCRSATVQLDSTRTVVGRGQLPAPDPRSARLALDRALETLRGHLVECIGQFTSLQAPEKAEELRGYGIGRGQRVQAAIQQYRPTAALYFRLAFQQQYWPNTRGAGATPSATDRQ